MGEVLLSWGMGYYRKMIYKSLIYKNMNIKMFVFYIIVFVLNNFECVL